MQNEHCELRTICTVFERRKNRFFRLPFEHVRTSYNMRKIVESSPKKDLQHQESASIHPSQSIEGLFTAFRNVLFAKEHVRTFIQSAFSSGNKRNENVIAFGITVLKLFLARISYT